VIDWDTSRELELPVVELFNLEIQRRRGLLCLVEAASEVLDRART
jgi:hypothetical protein